MEVLIRFFGITKKSGADVMAVVLLETDYNWSDEISVCNGGNKFNKK